MELPPIYYTIPSLSNPFQSLCSMFKVVGHNVNQVITPCHVFSLEQEGQPEESKYVTTTCAGWIVITFASFSFLIKKSDDCLE